MDPISTITGQQSAIGNLGVILPIVILILTFGLKLTIDRNVEAPTLIRSIYELPVDIVFLSLSFLAANTITISTEKDVRLLFCFGITIISIINVIIWRRSIRSFELEKVTRSVFLTAINYIITVSVLRYVIVNFLTTIK